MFKLYPYSNFIDSYQRFAYNSSYSVYLLKPESKKVSLIGPATTDSDRNTKTNVKRIRIIIMADLFELAMR